MSPDSFDDVDRALASGLSGLAPLPESSDDALAAARPRFRRARARARLAKAGGALVGLLAIGSVATLAAPHSGRTHVSVRTRPTTSVAANTPSTVGPMPTTVPTKPPATGPGAGGVPTTTAGSTRPGSQGPSSPATVPATTPGTDDRGGGPGASGGNGSGGAPTLGTVPDAVTTIPRRATTVPSSGRQTQTFSAVGGSITVGFSNHTTLTLERAAPAAGYTAQVRANAPDRIEVRFTHGEEVKSDIEVRVENGRVVRTDRGDG